MTHASQIRMIVSDVDGVWTDGKIIYVGDAREIKEFNVRDGLGVKIAQRAGIAVAVLTTRSSAALERRCRELAITEVSQGAKDKLEELTRISAKYEIPLENICYIGDDLPDLAPMMAASFSAAPADAAPEVFAAARWKMTRAGGAGVIRELVETILRERGEWDAVIQGFYAAHLTSQGV
jgi:3-deoxy-D-manno-octulosonate 8-phosphate phosphatase (KDO 8-P phosphatase)